MMLVASVMLMLLFLTGCAHQPVPAPQLAPQVIRVEVPVAIPCPEPPAMTPLELVLPSMTRKPSRCWIETLCSP